MQYLLGRHTKRIPYKLSFYMECGLATAVVDDAFCLHSTMALNCSKYRLLCILRIAVR